MPRRIAAALACAVAAVAMSALPLGLLGGPDPAAAVEEGTDPLQVDLDAITPGVVPQRGAIRLSGTVTNVDAQTWTTVNLYSFVSGTPMTTAAELADAAALPADASTGERIVDEDASTTLDEIAPGDTISFSFEVPRDLLPVSEQGVYWFGVQALGQGPEGRDLVADGRARTFIPLVRPSTQPLGLAVVVPLRRKIDHADDGRVDDLESWVTALGEGGRLRSLVDLGVSGSSRSVTYVVDPALLVAVRQLADGNPARSLRPTLPPDAGEGADEAPDGEDEQDGPDGSTSGTPTPVDPGASGDQGGEADADGDAVEDPEDQPVEPPVDALVARAQSTATAWLEQLDRALAGHEVLALPYGDLDVPAAAGESPATYTEARARATEVMAGLDVPSTPVLAAPGGYLDEAGLALADPADTVLVSDAMFAAPGETGDETGDESGDETDDESVVDASSGVAPTVLADGGHRLVVTSTASTSGPGPGEPRSVLSVRQRILAEAAVRATGDTGDAGRAPLVVMLPNDWTPSASSRFFSGLDVTWLDLRGVTSIAAGVATPVALGDLDYPRGQTRSELSAADFEAAGELGRAGQRLQNLLTRNDQVARTVADQALTTLSYTSRAEPAQSRRSAADATDWIEDRLARVRIEAPPSFTMTGTTGNFSTVVVNDLAQPVTVALAAEVDDDLTVTRRESVEVPASSSTRVLVQATAPTGGIHRVTLRVTDTDGAVLGSTASLTVRSLQVSNVIWVFLGAAATLLFGAILFRLVRRVRAARRASRARGGAGDPTHEPGAAPRERVGRPA